MAEHFKTIIVDLVTENGLSVCLVSEKWLVEDRVFYPTYGNYKNHKALLSHEEPNDSYEEYEFVLRKICEDYSTARAMLKKAVEESDLSTDQEAKRKKKTPKRLSPSPIRNPKTSRKPPMTAVHSAAFELFTEDIQTEAVESSTKNQLTKSTKRIVDQSGSKPTTKTKTVPIVTPNCAESVERPKNGAEKPIKAKTVERTGSQATTKATAVSLIEPEDCHEYGDFGKNTDVSPVTNDNYEAASSHSSSNNELQNSFDLSSHNEDGSLSENDDLYPKSAGGVQSINLDNAQSTQSFNTKNRQTKGGGSEPQSRQKGEILPSFKSPSQSKSSVFDGRKSSNAEGNSKDNNSIQVRSGSVQSQLVVKPKTRTSSSANGTPLSSRDDKMTVEKKIVRRVDSMDAKLDECLALLRQIKLEQKNTLPPNELHGLELPLKSVDDWESLEAALTISSTKQWLVSQLSDLGGLGNSERVHLVWKHLITDKLGMELSWKGLKGKVPVLGSLILKAVIASVKKESIDGGIRVIEEISKEWIWTAKRRFEREEEKKQNATRAADPF